jgi:hypothetical protein
MADTTMEPTTWPDLAAGLYDKLTGRGAEITYAFENLGIQVPTTSGPDTNHTAWIVNGTVSISTNVRS